MNSILADVRALIAEALQVSLDEISPDLAFGSIRQWDSMGHMGILLLLEEHFHVPIDADVIAKLTSVPAICNFLIKREPILPEKMDSSKSGRR